jgi:hypothetical protein
MWTQAHRATYRQSGAARPASPRRSRRGRSRRSQFPGLHTRTPPAAIGLFEQATGSILSSDIVYDGPLIDDAYHSDPDAYVAALETLRRLPISTVHG